MKQHYAHIIPHSISFDKSPTSAPAIKAIARFGQQALVPPDCRKDENLLLVCLLAVKVVILHALEGQAVFQT